MRTRIIVGAAVGVSILVAGVAMAWHRMHQDPPAAFPTGTTEAQTQYWEGRIRAIGPAAAYDEFTREVTPLDPGAQHGDAHIFGAALYATEGLSGISYCDANFSSGCYHEFIGQAIADKGVSVIPQLDAFCEKSTTGCPHGIGHGLITYFGYTGSDLAKAIPICLSLPDGKSLGGCMGGAFMEYNMRTMIDTNNTAVRPATSTKDLFSPCDEFSGRAEESCLLYQPQWWWTIFAQSSGLAGFAKMTGLCEKFAVGSANRNICFVGVGEMVSPGTGYDAEKSGQLCGSQTNDVSERFYCLAGSAIVFNGTGYAQKAQTVCQSIGDADRAASCMKYAQTSGALVNI